MWIDGSMNKPSGHESPQKGPVAEIHKEIPMCGEKYFT